MGTEQNPANQNNPKTDLDDEKKPVGEYSDKDRQKDQDDADKSQRTGDDDEPERRNRLPG